MTTEAERLAAHAERHGFETTAAFVRSQAAEIELLSSLSDKWNTECDEFREDNKRLAAEIERLKGNAEAAIAFCPTCAQGVTTSPDMTRDEVIFHSGRAARSLECDVLKAEIERLKATPPDQREDLRCVIADLTRQCQESDALLRQALEVMQESMIDEGDTYDAWKIKWDASTEAIKQHLGEV